jgi:hypothetical protein
MFEKHLLPLDQRLSTLVRIKIVFHSIIVLGPNGHREVRQRLAWLSSSRRISKTECSLVPAARTPEVGEDPEPMTLSQISMLDLENTVFGFLQG